MSHNEPWLHDLTVDKVSGRPRLIMIKMRQITEDVVDDEQKGNRKEENKKRGHFLLIKVGNNTVIYNRHAEGELVKLFFLYVLICLLTKKKEKKKRTEGNARGMSIGLRNENNTSSSAHLTSLPSAT